jgi:membrane protein DedA with SNARE-associated domain
VYLDKVAEISHYIAQYGYLAVFVLVFLQELGVPNPVSNELVLMYAGYTAHMGIVSLPRILLVSVTADFTGTTILFFLFYAFGGYIMNHKPRWFPLSGKRIDALKLRAEKGGWKGVFIGRLIPFIRGYVSVGAGLVRLKPSLFLTTVIASAITWSGGLVVVGWLMAPYWKKVLENMGLAENIVLAVLSIVLIFFVGRYFTRRFFSTPKAEN